jgi:hypothetical protein
VLQQRMSVAARKRQLATKVRRVVKGQKPTLLYTKTIAIFEIRDHAEVGSD